MSWPKAALGDVFEIARGGSPRPIEKFLTDGPDGLNWVSISDATRSGKVIERTERRIKPEGLSKSRWVEPGDFLLSNSMSFGRPYIMGTTGCIHDGWLVLKPGKTAVDPNYLYHLLGSEPVFAQFAKRATGTTVKNLNTQIVSETEIPLPPLSEQRRIAAILDQADALRRLRRRSLSRLSDLGKAIYLEMFGDPKVNRDNFKRLSFEQSCSDRTAAYDKIKTGDYEPKGEIAIVDQGKSLIAGWTSGAKNPYRHEAPVIVFGDHTRAIKLVDFPFVVGADGAKVLVPTDRFDAIFFSELLKLMPLPDLGYSRHMRELKRMTYICPPLEEQILFATRLSMVRRLRNEHSRHETILATLFASLQHRAFRGEL